METYAFRVLSSDAVVHNAFTTVSYAWLNPHYRGYLKHTSYVHSVPPEYISGLFSDICYISAERRSAK